MEGLLERPIWSERTRFRPLEAKSTTNQRKTRFEVFGHIEPSLPNRPSSPVSEPLAKTDINISGEVSFSGEIHVYLANSVQ